MARYPDTVPPDLLQAVDNAARQYGVPPAALVGIWRIESGSTYPNPAVNSSGYGGLFGTHDAYGPTQEQANLAAQILRHGFDLYHDWSSALSYYNSGTPTGGYHSVPGFDPSSGGGGGLVGDIGKGVSGAVGAAEGAASAAGSAIEHAAGLFGNLPGDKSVLKAIESPVDLVSAIVDIAKEFVHVIEWPFQNWDRALEVLGGFVLLMAGLIILGKRLAGSGPVEDVGGAITTVAQVPVAAATGGEAGAAQRSGRKAARRKHVRAAAEHSERERLKAAEPRATRRPVAMQKVSFPGPAAREPRAPRRAASSTGEGIPF